MKNLATQQDWAKTFREARGERTQDEASEALFGCPVATIRDWEQGRRTPPEWVRYLVLAQLTRSKTKTPRGV